MISYHNGRVTVWQGDCRDVLAGFEADSFDSAVVDPPYHFASIVKRFGKEGSVPAHFGTDGAYRRASKGFMGKQWDGGQIAHEPETWAAVLRVLKPGAHLGAFHAPKNWHRLACAIEDAGFEIRDTLLWLFGSGFPKSHDVSKAIDKDAGHWRGRAGAITIADQPAKGTEYERTDKGDPITAAAASWAGWGTSLKPAYEPIVLARKPLARGKTIAGNVMAYGTGALNIAPCRIESHDAEEGRTRHGGGIQGNGTSYELPDSKGSMPAGRWPANILHDGSPEVVAGFPETGPSPQTYVRSADGFGKTSYNVGEPAGKESLNFGDSGSAARFFATFPQEPQSRMCYGSKADGDDRVGSKHPTVKPMGLIQWLCRLITPPRGHILDCFAGTGTTAEAALREGFQCTLIEREDEYLADIDRRMALALEGSVGRSVAIAKLKPEGDPLPLFARAAE